MESRANLKAARQAAQQITSKVAEAEAALAKSQTIIAEAETEAARYTRLDDAIAAWRVQALKSGSDPRKLPAELAEQKAKRAAALEELDLARHSQQTIEAEVSGLQLRLKSVEAEHARAAIDVLHSYAADLGTELQRINHRAYELRMLIRALAEVRVLEGDNLVMFRLGNNLLSALEGDGSGSYPPIAEPELDTTRRWTRRHQALLEDPDATIDDIRAVMPTDYQWQGESGLVDGRLVSRTLVCAGI